MAACPQCKLENSPTAERCGRCQTDLRLLALHQARIEAAFQHAETARRAGEIARAVDAYLVVLEIDPTHEHARDALGPVLRSLRVAGRVNPPPPLRFWTVLLSYLLVAALAAGFGFWLGLARLAP